MALSAKSLAGPGYVILNALRIMNIMGLLAITVGCAVMLIRTYIITGFFFFDAVSHVVTMLISFFLIVSELSLFRSYFARNWPLLSPAHGFVTLGIAMIVLGLHMLGSLNVPAQDDALGTAFHHIVLGSGVVITILGFCNIIASYIFRDPRNAVTARQIRAQGAVAVQRSFDMNPASPPLLTTPRSGSPPRKSPRAKSFFGVSLPSYHTASSAHASPVREVRHSFGLKIPVHISAPMEVNPQFKHLVRPEVARGHPSGRGNMF